MRRWIAVAVAISAFGHAPPAGVAFAGQGRAGPSGKPAAVRVTGSGFGWVDAGIGAAAALGLVLVVFGLRLSAHRGEAEVSANERVRQEET